MCSICRGPWILDPLSEHVLGGRCQVNLAGVGPGMVTRYCMDNPEVHAIWLPLVVCSSCGQDWTGHHDCLAPSLVGR